MPKEQIPATEKALPPASVEPQPTRGQEMDGSPAEARLPATPVVAAGHMTNPVRAAGMLTAAAQHNGAPGRARMMSAMQRTVGNAGLSRMVSATQPIQRRCTCAEGEGEGGGMGGECNCHAGERGKEPVQRRAAAVKESAQTTVPPAVTSVLRAGGGQPLDATIGGRMERALGADLSSVRIHTDARAAVAARGMTGSGTGRQQIARQPDRGGGAPPASDPAGPAAEGAISEDLARKAGFAATVFRNMPRLSDADEQRLRQAIGGTRLYSLIRFRNARLRDLDNAESRGMGMLRFTPTRQGELQRVNDEIYAELRRLGLSSENELIDAIERKFPTMVLERAKHLVLTLLDENGRIARGELERYSQQVCSPDINGLLEADAELGMLNPQSLRLSIQQAEKYASRVIAGVPQTPADYGIPANEESVMVYIQRLPELRDELLRREEAFNKRRAEHGRRYPILLAEGYHPGLFSMAPLEKLSELVAEPVQKILKNIEDVKEEIKENDLKVWNLNNVIEMTLVEMGADTDPLLLELVSNRISREKRDESFIEMALAALAITTTIIAGILTAPAGGWGAFVVGGMWGGYFLSRSIDTYMAETAAENVALDPDFRDISMNEPTLTWIIIDALTLGLDVSAFLRVIRPFARALTATRSAEDFALFAGRARAVLPAAEAEAVIERAGRRFGMGPAAMNAARGAAKLELTAAEIISRMERHVATQNERLANAIRNGNRQYLENLELTEKVVNILLNPRRRRRVFAAQYGNALERAVSRAFNSDSVLSRMLVDARNAPGTIFPIRPQPPVTPGVPAKTLRSLRPDFGFKSGPLQGQIIDLTTPGQVASKGLKYHDRVIVFSYDRPSIADLAPPAPAPRTR